MKKGQTLVRLGANIEQRGRIRELYTFEGLTKVETDEAFAGDIAAVAGFEDLFVGETLADPADPTKLPSA